MNSEITFCTKNDLNEVRNFIDNYWKKNHILSISRNILDWYYKNIDGSYNFILGKIKGEISGVLGFIPNYKYDLDLQDKKIIWLALWKVQEKCEDKTLGIKLIAFLKEQFDCSVIAVNGINNNAKSIFNLLGFNTGKLNHYYLFSNYANTNFLKLNEKFEKNFVTKSGEFWQEILLNDLNKLIKDKKNIELNSFKTITYLKNKYLKNNFYEYKIYKIFGKHNEFGLIILKIVKEKNANILRIIDYLGNENILLNSGKGLDKVMKKYDVEYVDFLNYGFDENILKSIGFKINSEKDNIIIPNYFEPLIFKNLSINFAFKNYKKDEFKLNIFKGDGDQERPNIIQY